MQDKIKMVEVQIKVWQMQYDDLVKEQQRLGRRIAEDSGMYPDCLMGMVQNLTGIAVSMATLSAEINRAKEIISLLQAD